MLAVCQAQIDGHCRRAEDIGDHVKAFATHERVISRATLKHVIAAPAFEQVITGTALQQVVAGRALECVISAATDHIVHIVDTLGALGLARSSIFGCQEINHHRRGKGRVVQRIYIWLGIRILRVVDEATIHGSGK